MAADGAAAPRGSAAPRRDRIRPGARHRGAPVLAPLVFFGVAELGTLAFQMSTCGPSPVSAEDGSLPADAGCVYFGAPALGMGPFHGAAGETRPTGEPLAVVPSG